MRDIGVRDMLRRNYRLFLAATMLPDMGYLISQFRLGDGWWGEDLHWAPFLNGLWSYNQARCRTAMYPPVNSPECEKLWTIYFGILSHSLADIQWHGGYIFRFGVMESGAAVKTGPFNTAHTIADNLGDLPAVHMYGERDLIGSIDLNLMTNIINSYADAKKRPRVSSNTLAAAFYFQEAWYQGVKLAWPVYYFFKLKYKWGHDNYYGTLGGVDNTARRVAEVADLISWDNRNWKLTKITNLTTGGSWPFSFFKVTKSDNSITLERSSHDPNYQLDPRGTYNCRWGLYLGGWRWFQYGDVSRCPYKATADYQQGQCNRFRYWPLSCKTF